MAKPISAVPQIFATATSPLPLANLDSDFAYVVTKLNDLSTYSNYVADTGTVNALVLSYPVGITLSGLNVGTLVQFKPANANTGPATLQLRINNVDVGSAAPILDSQGNPLTAGLLKNTIVYSAFYDGTNWILQGVLSLPGVLPSYSGNALKYLQVNAGETAVDWALVANELPSVGGNALKTLRVNSEATGVEWATTDLGLAQTIITSNYTLTLADANRQIYHPTSDTTARTLTIPSNGSVPFPIGTTITIVNEVSAGALTIGITSDTLQRIQSSGTAPFTLNANGIATAVKITSTKWVINGVGFA